MKTPKHLLLQRHQALEPELDAMRQNALAALAQGRPRPADSWRHFVYSVRWHLAGLSAVWLAVLLLSVGSDSGSAMTIAKDRIPPARVLLAALLKNRRELIELTETPSGNDHAALPPRRSEIQPSSEIV